MLRVPGVPEVPEVRGVPEVPRVPGVPKVHGGLRARRLRNTVSIVVVALFAIAAAQPISTVPPRTPGTPGILGTSGTLGTLGTPGTSVPVEIHTSLTRTAVWIGEPVTYTVELRCGPHTDILLEDVGEDRLQLDGGEIVQVQADHDDSGERVIRRMRYTFVTFRVDVSELRIAPLTVRYYAHAGGGATAGATPAGEVVVPAAVVAVRSAIAGGDTIPEPRHPIEIRPAPARLRLAAQSGWLLIAVVVVPFAFLSLDVVRQARRAWAWHAERRGRRRRVSLDDLRLVEADTETGRIDAYEQLDRLVRDHLQVTTGIATHALTPVEIRHALEQRAPLLPHGEIEELLAACERARYAGPVPPAEEWARALRQAGEILEGA